MAAYISVPRDLTRVKAKVFMNLTKRQVICFGTAVLIGVPAFFFLKEYAGKTAATPGMMIPMLPLFMYQRNRQPPGKFPNPSNQAPFIPPKGRAHRTANYFALLQQQADLEQEVDAIVSLSEKEKS